MVMDETQTGDITLLEAKSSGRVMVIADDLTGACDAAGAFAAHGIHARVIFDTVQSEALEDAQVLSFSTESRDVDPAAMKALLQEAIERCGSTDLLFKKIDSVFRGNTFREIAEVAALANGHLVVVAPAFPAQGRICQQGVVRYELNGQMEAIAVHKQLESLGVRIVGVFAKDAQAAARNEVSLSGDCTSCILLVDAEEERELLQVVRAILARDVPVIWIGSAGLAHALAETLGNHPPPSVPETKGQTVFCVGSNHPRTKMQIEALFAEYPRPSLLRLPRGTAREEDVRQFFESLDVTEIGCVVMTGGDTAALVCRALGVAAIDIAGEVAPGIPCGVLRGGPMNGATAVLKSGGFGAQDLFVKIATLFEKDGLN